MFFVVANIGVILVMAPKKKMACIMPIRIVFSCNANEFFTVFEPSGKDSLGVLSDYQWVSRVSAIATRDCTSSD